MRRCDVKRLSLTIGVLTAAVALASPAFADTVSLSGTGSLAVAIDTGTGEGTPPSTIQFNAIAPTTFTSPGSFTQGLTFTSGYDPSSDVVPFTVDDSLTLNGITQVVAINGVMDVSPTTTPDTIQILSSTSPVLFGDLALSVVGQTFSDSPPFPGGVLSTTQTFDVAPVPLPASLPLFLTGLAGLGFLALRRKQRSQSQGIDSVAFGAAC